MNVNQGVKNIIIAGIGGQGVNSLSTVIQQIILDKGGHCKGSIFKGGAQRRGTVYTTIRIFDNEESASRLPSTIPKRSCHIFIGFELSESLRYAQYYNQDTRILVNDFTFPFYSERFTDTIIPQSPEQQLKENFRFVNLIQLNEKSKKLFGDESMVNVLMGLEAIKHGLLDIDGVQYLDFFQKKTRLEYEVMIRLIEEYNLH